MLNFWRYGRRAALSSCYQIRCCSELPTSTLLYRGKLQYTPVVRPVASLHTSPYVLDQGMEDKRRWPFHVTMTDEQKRKKQEKIDAMKEEKEPDTLFGKVKYYLKRYWYIAVPAHMVGSTAWLGGLYALVHCGVDVVALLQTLHMPSVVIEKIQNVPPSAGVLVVALLLYKVATPLRYMTTLVLIQAAFWTLRRMGKLRTAREVEFKRTQQRKKQNRWRKHLSCEESEVQLTAGLYLHDKEGIAKLTLAHDYRMRTEYEKSKIKYGRKLYRYRNMGVRDVLRKNSRGHIRKDDSDQSNRKN